MKTNKADTWFSRFIRLRDCDEDGLAECITCGRRLLVKNMDCGHYVKRQYSGGRYSEINCHAQCKHCNNFEQGRDQVYRKRLIELYGEEKIFLLEAGKRAINKTNKTALEYIEKYYKEKALELSKKKNLKWW